jgi:hypothetical protein
MSVALNCFGQNGYVRLLKNDSILTGFIRQYISVSDGEPGIELWKTKKDKDPIRLLKSTITEYALNKDTIKVLHNFAPFENSSVNYSVVDANFLSRGKINLLIIKNYRNNQRISNYTGGGLIPALIDEMAGNYTYLYLLENPSSGYLRALPSKKEKLRDLLSDFFPERYIELYNEKKGIVSYKNIKEFVTLYNSR